MRIGGLASGMDIDTMVKDLMKAERIPLDKYKQQKQKLEWQRDDYRAINTLLLDFRSDLTQMKLTTKYRVRNVSTTNDERVTATASSAASLSSYSIGKVTQLASSERMLGSGKVANGTVELSSKQSLHSQTEDNAMWKQGVVETKTKLQKEAAKIIPLDIPVGSNPVDVNDIITNVESWSIKVNGKSYKVVTDRNNLDDSSVLIKKNGANVDLEFKENIAKDSTIKVDYIAASKTETLKLNYNTSSLQLSRGSINEILDGGQIKLTKIVKEGDSETKVEETFLIDQIGTMDYETGKIQLNSNFMENYLPPEKPEDGKEYNYSLELTYDQNYTTFSIDTVTSKGEQHENFLIAGNETINSVVNKVNASNVGVSMFYDEFSGKTSLIRTETGKFNTDDTLFSGADISTSGTLITDIFKLDNSQITAGENAIFEINGLETERNSNTFDISGVTFTLKQTFEDAPVSLSISNDSSKVVDNIKEFVTKYNELIDKIQKKVNEEVYRSYQPLTDDQRESLSDKQQEQWEEKAKSGLLRRDPILSSVLTKMRLNFSNPVQNDDVNPIYSQLASIGIKTTANYLEGGKLEINEAELKAAIEADPSSVEKLFNGSGETDSQKGIVQRLYDTVSASFDQLKEKAGNSNTTNANFDIGKLLNNVNKQIDRFEDKMIKVEDRYWRQFTAMEKAIQRSNEQMAYLMNQFGGGM